MAIILRPPSANMAAMWEAIAAAQTAAEAAMSAAGSASTSAANAAGAASSASSSASAVAGRVTTIEQSPYLRGTFGKTTITANIAVGDTAPITVVFETPLQAANYVPLIGFEGTSGLLGALTGIVPTANKAVDRCVVLVKNTSLISLGLNAVVNVVALVPKP